MDTTTFLERMKKEIAEERQEREKAWTREWKFGIVQSFFACWLIYGVIAGPKWLSAAAIALLLVRADLQDWVAKVNRRKRCN